MTEAARRLLKEGTELLTMANETVDLYKQKELMEQAAQKHTEANSLMEQRRLLMAEYIKSGMV